MAATPTWNWNWSLLPLPPVSFPVPPPPRSLCLCLQTLRQINWCSLKTKREPKSKKKLSKVATSSGNNRQILAFFWFIFYEGTYRKNTLKILSSNFCVDAAKNGAQCRTALPCMLCMQSMDPTAGFVVVYKLFFSMFFFYFLAVFFKNFLFFFVVGSFWSCRFWCACVKDDLF